MSEISGAKPAITIVTITRNNLEGLRRTFASLAAQEFRDVQHVVVDGASTDGSVEWLRENRAFDDTVVVSEPDRGVYDAMNKGARLATGRLINFLNAGDRFADPEVLSRVEASQSESGWAWGFGLARVVNSAGNSIRPVRALEYSRRRHALGLISIPHQATFMTTELFRTLGGFNDRFRIAADTDMLVRAGAVCQPALWGSVDVEYLAGGVSDRRVFEQIYQKHRIRQAIPGAALHPRVVDLVWTACQILLVATRKVGKRVLNALSGGRFTRWWATRGL